METLLSKGILLNSVIQLLYDRGYCMQLVDTRHHEHYGTVDHLLLVEDGHLIDSIIATDEDGIIACSTADGINLVNLPHVSIQVTANILKIGSVCNLIEYCDKQDDYVIPPNYFENGLILFESINGLPRLIPADLVESLITNF